MSHLERTDPKLKTWESAIGVSADTIFDTLHEHRLIALNGNTAAISHHTLFSGFADGRIFTAFYEDSARLNRWLTAVPNSTRVIPAAAHDAVNQWRQLTSKDPRWQSDRWPD